MHRAHLFEFPYRVDNFEPLTDAVETLGMHRSARVLEIIVRTDGCDFMLNNINICVFVLQIMKLFITTCLLYITTSVIFVPTLHTTKLVRMLYVTLLVCTVFAMLVRSTT